MDRADASPCHLLGEIIGGLLGLNDVTQGRRLAEIPLVGCMRPWLYGVPCQSDQAHFADTADGWTSNYATAMATVRSVVTIRGDHVELSGSITAQQSCVLNRLDVLAPGTRLNLWDVVNFRNRHHSPVAWPELPLSGKDCTTDTFSTDWQFAPHPSMLMFRRGDAVLLLGALDLPTGFGLRLAASDHTIGHLHLDYGDGEHGQRLAAGETMRFPRFVLLLRHGGVAEALAAWNAMLMSEGSVPDPACRIRHAWHREPLYCTWIDQCARARLSPPAELGEQVGAAGPAVRALDHGLVRRALAVIRHERLPFRTILIDDGWQVARGDWRAHPDRFPDLRALVDEIHAAGLKAMAWWAWPEIADDVVVDPDLLVGGGWRNRHGARMYDFSDSRVRQGYLDPLLHRLLSSDPGCYDLDGIKTDFMADKIHADMPLADPSWRGEENYFVRLYGHLRARMDAIKPDACHIGCSGHPWLASLLDINRTFDVHGDDVREHACRGRMLQWTSPGTPVALDFHNYVDGLDDWFALGRREGWSFQVGNVLAMRRDVLSSWEPADSDFHERLRLGLGATIPLAAPRAAS